MDCISNNLSLPSTSFPTRSLTLQVLDHIMRWWTEVEPTSCLLTWGVMHAWLLFHSSSDIEFKDF